jgi:hypothetical protein
MTKQDLIDSMIELATEMNHPYIDEHGTDWEYYLLAELYRTLDQYCIDNDKVVCVADRWI